MPGSSRRCRAASGRRCRARRSPRSTSAWPSAAGDALGSELGEVATAVKCGVLALQGAFREHREVLEALGLDAIDVRAPHELDAVDVLLLPGGESTTMSRLLDTSGLRSAIEQRLSAGMPVFGTCAGLILLAREVVDGRPDQRSFGVLDVRARRNAYGRQAESFEAALDVGGLRGGPFPGVFIRAPGVDAVGPDVEVLASHEGRPVLVRQGSVWASSFHPELSHDLRIHQWFLREVGP